MGLTTGNREKERERERPHNTNLAPYRKGPYSKTSVIKDIQKFK